MVIPQRPLGMCSMMKNKTSISGWARSLIVFITSLRWSILGLGAPRMDRAVSAVFSVRGPSGWGTNLKVLSPHSKIRCARLTDPAYFWECSRLMGRHKRTGHPPSLNLYVHRLVSCIQCPHLNAGMWFVGYIFSSNQLHLFPTNLK